MKQLGNSFAGYIPEAKSPRNRLSLDLNTIETTSTASSKHFHTKSYKDSPQISFSNMMTTYSPSLELSTDTNLVSNSTYNIRRKINSILNELSPKNSKNAKPFYINTEPANNEFTKKAYSLFQTDIDELRKGKQESFNTTKSSTSYGEKNKLKREINYFSMSNKLVAEPKSSRNFNRPMINIDKPILNMRADDFILNSPTASRKGLVNSTFFRNHYNQNLAPHKSNIFGDGFIINGSINKQPVQQKLKR